MPREVSPKNPERVCAECGAEFTAKHGRAQFCTTDHQRKFHRRMKDRGRALMPLAIAWRQGKRGSSDLSSYSMAQMCALLDQWATEDKTAGRRPELVAERKMAQDWKACDLGLPVI
jgi:hypothetical protein